MTSHITGQLYHGQFSTVLVDKILEKLDEKLFQMNHTEIDFYLFCQYGRFTLDGLTF